MFISDQDVKAAEDKYGAPNYGALGSVVDTRTYLRWLPDKKRRETFYERNARVVNYNVGLAVGILPTNELQKEADTLFDMMNQLLVWGSGRTAWVAGTKATQLVPESTMNCSAAIINRISVFGEAFHLLCLGCGFGFRIYPDDVEQIPELSGRGHFVTSFDKYVPVSKEVRKEDTSWYFNETLGCLTIEVGDSREGWVAAIMALLQLYTRTLKTDYFDFTGLHFPNVDYAQFNFDNVRPEGERIKGFGGIASGPNPLIDLLKEYVRIFEEEVDPTTKKLEPINCMDMMCIMGDVVRSGNVRRSSLITLFHHLDKTVREAKRGLWTDPNMSHKRYRSMSNNSILFDGGYKPSLDELKELMQTIRFEGEPGFVRADVHKQRRYEAALKRRPNDNPMNYVEQAGITNPCFAPGTLILTKEGHFKIEDLVGKEVEVYDGENWVTIDNFRVTGKDKEVYNVTLHNGQSILATSNHSFYLEDGTKKLLKELEPGDRLLHYNKSEEGYTVSSIDFHSVSEKVYCCTVPTNHRVALANGVITGQCGEINLTGGYADLKAGSFCNLVSLPLTEFVDGKRVKFELLEHALSLITRFAIRQTLIDISLPDWNITQQKERLIGVDLCGIWEAFDKLGVAVDSEVANHLRRHCKFVVNSEAERYSKLLDIEMPLLTTTGKPNGTYAQLKTISSGCHPPYAPYYIRRIRMAKSDALAQTLIDQGIPYYPETSEWERYFLSNRSEYLTFDSEGKQTTTVWDMLAYFDEWGKQLPDEIKTVVFEFPVKTEAKRATSEISAIEQLENYRMQMLYYIEHNQSVTVTVGDDEWDSVAEWFDLYWEDVVGISLLPKFADNVYPLLPYQECDQVEYEERVAQFPSYPLLVDADLLAQYEMKIEGDVDDVDVDMAECSTGACPVR